MLATLMTRTRAQSQRASRSRAPTRPPAEKTRVILKK
jgi:hypothetical protein